MAEPVSRIIWKVSDWPLEERLEYLKIAYRAENERRRRRKIYLAMRKARTEFLKQGNRNERS